MKIKTIVFFFLFILIITNATAYGIHNIDFGYVENGKSYGKDLVISLSPKDTDGYYKIDKGGDLAPYLLVTPTEFRLERSQKQVVKVSLVPENLERGNYTGWIVARGQEPISNGGMIGYTVSLKSNIKASVVVNERKEFGSVIISLIIISLCMFVSGYVLYSILVGKKDKKESEKNEDY